MGGVQHGQIANFSAPSKTADLRNLIMGMLSSDSQVVMVYSISLCNNAHLTPNTVIPPSAAKGVAHHCTVHQVQ